MKKYLPYLLAFVLLLSGCDGTAWSNTIEAKSFPEENVLSIPVQARLNQGDFLAYGGYHFTADPSVIQTVHNWAVMQGMSVQRYEDQIGNSVVIENDGNYYFLGQLASEEENVFEFSGMWRPIRTAQGNIPVLLPLHLISDPIIRGNLGAQMKTGESYLIEKDVCTVNETVMQFFEFYETVYGSDVIMEEAKIALNDDVGEIIVSFYVQDEAHYFSIEIG